jgi:hypothetical protein
MIKTISFLSFICLLNIYLRADIPQKTFSKEEIGKLSGAYLNYKLDFNNPVLVDVDKDGDFDALKFDDGNVEYYKNTGTLEAPSFILENRNYESYDHTLLIDVTIPYPIFFADNDSDGDMDMFVIKEKAFNKYQNRYEYKAAVAENALSLDTGTLITIILVLVIVILVLAILR